MEAISKIDVLPPGVDDISKVDEELLKIYAVLQAEFQNSKLLELWVNEWSGMRINHWCGYRDSHCKIGAMNSAHKKGLALDIHIGSPYAPIEVRKARSSKLWAHLKTHGASYGIKRLEDIDATPTWCHIDLVEKPGWNHEESVYVFKP